MNNNAAAVLLALAATARGGEVLVSRGQLVEIGDGFRIPDILAESGADAGRGGHHQPHLPARLRTRLDGELPRRAARAHEQLPRRGLHRRAVAERAGGAGARARRRAGRRPGQRRAGGPGAVRRRTVGARAAWRPAPTWSPSAATSCWAGRRPASPSARRRPIGAMRRHPLARALRIDKLDLAALDALLRLYLDPARAVERVPTLAMLATTVDALQARAETLRAALAGRRTAGRRPTSRDRALRGARRRRRAAGDRRAQRGGRA